MSLYLVVGSVYPYRACEAGRLQGVAGLPYLLVGPGGAFCLGKRQVAYQTVFPVVDNLYLDGVLAGFDIGCDVQAVRARPHPAGVLAVYLHFGCDHNLAERQVARQSFGVVYLELVAVYGGAGVVADFRVGVFRPVAKRGEGYGGAGAASFAVESHGPVVVDRCEYFVVGVVLSAYRGCAFAEHHECAFERLEGKRHGYDTIPAFILRQVAAFARGRVPKFGVVLAVDAETGCHRLLLLFGVGEEVYLGIAVGAVDKRYGIGRGRAGKIRLHAYVGEHRLEVGSRAYEPFAVFAYFLVAVSPHVLSYFGHGSVAGRISGKAR